MNVVSPSSQIVRLTPMYTVGNFTITDESTNVTTAINGFNLVEASFYNVYEFELELIPNRNYILKGYLNDTLVVYDKLLCIDEDQQPTFTQRETTNDFIIYEQ